MLIYVVNGLSFVICLIKVLWWFYYYWHTLPFFIYLQCNWCLSRSYIMSKRLNIFSNFFHRRVATPFFNVSDKGGPLWLMWHKKKSEDPAGPAVVSYQAIKARSPHTNLSVHSLWHEMLETQKRFCGFFCHTTLSKARYIVSFIHQ